MAARRLTMTTTRRSSEGEATTHGSLSGTCANTDLVEVPGNGAVLVGHEKAVYGWFVVRRVEVPWFNEVSEVGGGCDGWTAEY